MKKIFLISLLFLSLFVSVISASQAEHLFGRANEFYKNNDFDSAALYYEKALDQGCINSSLYYNTANSYFRLKNMGRSILNYERAYKLKPNDADIKANLNFARKNIIDKIDDTERSFLVKFMRFNHNVIPLNIQLIIIILLLFIVSIGFLFILFIRGNRRLWAIYFTILSTLILVPISISTGIKIYSIENDNYAIILEESIDAQNAPDGTKTLFTLHEGTKVKIIKNVGNWDYISLSNGVSGWIKSEYLEII